MMMTFADARRLAIDVLTKHAVAAEHAEIVANHLVDAASAGHAFAGLPRVLALVNNLKNRPAARPISIERKGRNAARIDGGGTNGYVTSLIAMDLAIDLAREAGIGMVGVRDTWFSGRLSYYVERAAQQGFVAMHTANTSALVAPAGGIDRIFGTNPIAFAFPSDPEPLVVDFSTGMTTWGEVLLREKLGKPLEPGWAIDAEGRPTTDPTEALRGAFVAWGGHRGSALALVIQALAILCGGKPVADDVAESGFFFLAFNPELLMPLGEFRAKVGELVRHLETSRPAPGAAAVRVPGRTSAARRAESLRKGMIEVDEAVYASLVALRDQAAAN